MAEPAADVDDIEALSLSSFALFWLTRSGLGKGPSCNDELTRCRVFFKYAFTASIPRTQSDLKRGGCSAAMDDVEEEEEREDVDEVAEGADCEGQAYSASPPVALC
jgi:hypothetical protein